MALLISTSASITAAFSDVFVRAGPRGHDLQLKGVLTEDQRQILWKFVRGDVGADDFEKWLYNETALETAFEDEEYLTLIGCNFRSKEDTFALKASIRSALQVGENCHCSAVRDLDNIEMGGDGFFEKFFATLTELARPPTDQWWLYISRCNACSTNWLVAQEERIHDVFYVERISDHAVQQAKAGTWPDRFQTYADVLHTGGKLGVREAKFISPMSGALQVTVEELLRTSPKITAEEIGLKLGIEPHHAQVLIDKIKKDGADPLAGYIDTK